MLKKTFEMGMGLGILLSGLMIALIPAPTSSPSLSPSPQPEQHQPLQLTVGDIEKWAVQQGYVVMSQAEYDKQILEAKQKGVSRFTFVIQQGLTVSEVADLLVQGKIISDPSAFLQEYSRQGSKPIRIGTYSFATEVPLKQVVAKLTTPPTR